MTPSLIKDVSALTRVWDTAKPGIGTIPVKRTISENQSTPIRHVYVVSLLSDFLFHSFGSIRAIGASRVPMTYPSNTQQPFHHTPSKSHTPSHPANIHTHLTYTHTRTKRPRNLRLGQSRRSIRLRNLLALLQLRAQGQELRFPMAGWRHFCELSG